MARFIIFPHGGMSFERHLTSKPLTRRVRDACCFLSADSQTSTEGRRCSWPGHSGLPYSR